MTALSLTMNSADFVLGVAEKIQELELKKKAIAFINAIVTIAAVLTAFCSYVSIACQIFWDEHGETIKAGAIRFAIAVLDFSVLLFQAGRDFRGFANKVTAQVSDRVFYALTEA